MDKAILSIILGIIIAIIGALLLIRAYRLRNKGGHMEDNRKEEPTIIKDTKVKLNAKDTEKAIGMEITKPTELSNVKVDVTVQNVKEATGLKVTATNTEFAVSNRLIICSCGNRIAVVTTHGYKPTVKCPKCGKEYKD